MTRTQNRTDLDMLTSGRWVKAGRRHYRHESGHEVRWNYNACGWTSTATDGLYPTLWAARYETERNAR